MKQQSLYLKSNVQAEPLVDNWYAWPHLIPPATAARNFTERHLRIMDSYISAPDLHAAAVRNPKMLGGPFVDYSGRRMEEIRELRTELTKRRADLVELSQAIEDLDRFLSQEGRGYSLEPLYQRIPSCLRGYVELVYDRNNHPSFRIIESLLYQSEYYKAAAQTIMLSLTAGDSRAFILSTPRLELDAFVDINLPFADERIDKLFSLQRSALEWAEIESIFPSVTPQKKEVLRSFFSTDRPKPYSRYEGNKARWRYFGHACILIEVGGLSILCDPVISYTYETNIPRYTYEDLPDKIDYVLITHNHQDHILFETLLQIRHKIGMIVVPRNGGGALQDPSLKLILHQIGFKNVTELEECGIIDANVVSITALPFLGEHGDLNVQTKAAYLVNVGKHSLMFAADSCNVEPALYEHIRRHYGPVDVLFLGMECDGAPVSWIYGPLLTSVMERGMDQSRRLAGSHCEQALDMVRSLQCKEVYVYAMGQEPWLNHIMSLKYTEESRPIVESNRFLEACRDLGIAGERLFGEKEILLE